MVTSLLSIECKWPFFLKKREVGKGKKANTCQIFQGCSVMILIFANVIAISTNNSQSYVTVLCLEITSRLLWVILTKVDAKITKKMGYYCTVPQCTSLAGKTKNVKFHRFPRDTTMADKWNNILKRGKPYTKYSKVCSRHFTAADYNATTMGKNKGIRVFPCCLVYFIIYLKFSLSDQMSHDWRYAIFCVRENSAGNIRETGFCI